MVLAFMHDSFGCVVFPKLERVVDCPAKANHWYLATALCRLLTTGQADGALFGGRGAYTCSQRILSFALKIATLRYDDFPS